MTAKAKTPVLDPSTAESEPVGPPEEATHLEAVPEPETLDETASRPARDPDLHEEASDDRQESPEAPLPPTAGSDDERPAAPAPPGGRRTRTVLRWLLRGVLVAAVLAAGFAVWPEFRDRVLDPVEANAADTAAVRDRVDRAEAQVADLEAQGQELRSRIAALESDAAAFGSGLESVSTRVDDIAPVIDGHTEALARLDEQLAALVGRVDADSIDAAIGIDVVRSMELMSRARLFLYQANYGLAGDDVRAAREVLQRVTEQSEAPAVFTLAVERLDRVLENLPERPVLASDDLDVAWQILLAESRVSALSLTSSADASSPASPADVQSGEDESNATSNADAPAASDTSVGPTDAGGG